MIENKMNDIKILFAPVHSGDDNYQWVNVELGSERVGKARIKRQGDTIIINNINIFEQYEGRGYATRVLNLFRESADILIAENVRATARSFWEAMGFYDSRDGHYRWERRKQGRLKQEG